MLANRGHTSGYGNPEVGSIYVGRPRPTSMILSSPSASHMPGSIFPDIHLQQHTHLRPAPPNPRPEFSPSRRHTTYLSPIPRQARRESRPLRSSPLAGPSLALSVDGTLSGSDESNGSKDSTEDKSKYRPSRIYSSPDVSNVFSDTSSVFSSGSDFAPSSPPCPTSKSAPVSPQLVSASLKGLDDPPPLAIPPPTKQSRRLSWGLTKLKELPHIHTSSSSVSKHSKKHHRRSHSPAPPVPEIPTWARPSFTRASSPPASPNRRSAFSPPPAFVPSRPSTAPGPVSSTRPTLRHSSTAPLSPPSTSRDPELNWLSAAAPPKFSRLSIKAEGVVMPVSAKDTRRHANRRSTINTFPSPGPSRSAERPRMNSLDVSNDQGKGKEREGSGTLYATSRNRSRTSLASLGSAISTTSSVTLPMPPFHSAESRRGSSSSLSSVSSRSPSTPTYSLSRTSSLLSVEEVDELGVIQSHEGDMMQMMRESRKEEVSGVELRVNDVRVDVIERPGRDLSQGQVVVMEVKSTKDAAEAVKGSLHPTAKGEHTVEKVRKSRSGTIKRMWKRVIGTVKG